MKRVVQLLVLSVMTAGLFACVAMPTAAAATGDATSNIGGKPANPQKDNPRSKSIFIYELKPGASKSDQVQVVNNTTKSKNIAVYAVDSQLSSGGAFACAQKADTPVEVGTWIKLDQNVVRVPARGQQKVGFTVTVPSNATPGEHNGCIAIQDADPTTASRSNGISISFRSAIRVVITVPGKIIKGLSFAGLSLQETKDGLLGTVALYNSGNVSVDTTLTPKLVNLFGLGGHQPDSLYPILSKSKGTFTLPLNKPFWGGWYKFRVAASYSDDVSKSLGQPGGHRKTITSGTIYTFLPPRPLALLIELLVLIIVAGLVGYYVGQRWVRQNLGRGAIDYKVRNKNGESIQAVAAKHNVSWKKLARLNRLKAPYHLEKGQVVKIPKQPATAAETKPSEE